MWLIACNRGDVAAIWAARGLAERGLAPVEVVSAEALAYSTGFEHRLGDDGPSVRFELTDGRRIASEEVSGLLNRLTHAPMEHLGIAPESEREYAMQEVSAFFLSWLTAMPGPVLNRPVPFGLAGPSMDPFQWLTLAARAGLPAPVRRAPATRGQNGDAPQAGSGSPAAPSCNVVVACGATYGPPLPERLAAACVRLAELSGADLLGVELRPGASGQLEFAAAHALPDLRIGGEPLIDGLAGALRAGVAA